MDTHLNFYDKKFNECIELGLSVTDAASAVIDVYLDNKPSRRGKNKISLASRNELFWSSQFLTRLVKSDYTSDFFVLAFSRYLSQNRIANYGLVAQIANLAPEVIVKGFRYSGLVLKTDSPRWREVERLSIEKGKPFSELIAISRVFHQGHLDRLEWLNACQKPLSSLSPLEILNYSSLYAFQYLLSDSGGVNGQPESGKDTRDLASWYAMKDILLWKVGASPKADLYLTESKIGQSLKAHLTPFIFPSDEQSPEQAFQLYENYIDLLEAQKELNSFFTESVDVFCFDDSVRFEMSETGIRIVDCDLLAKQAWAHDGEKLNRLHQYWFYRALGSFVDSGLAAEPMGRPENHEANQFAYVKAIQTTLQLTEVYGLGESITTSTGLKVNVFEALLSIELMTAFYKDSFLFPYMEYLEKTGNCWQALSLLCMKGLVEDMQNRFPFTWSEYASKVKGIQPWTVNKDFPKGNYKAAKAILDFWTNDLGALFNDLSNGATVKAPEIFEKPVLKIGRYVFQLPWMLAQQNNSSAAINNLRRVGARRVELKDETQRIEHNVAKLFRARGFKVIVGYHPVKVDGYDPGEVDLICVLDGYVLVIEVKSTFLRSSKKEAWIHKTSVLRKAGMQLLRKTQAVEKAISEDADLSASLGFDSGYRPHRIVGWIVDTSIECDHCYFSGFLKISLEEVLIALRDEVFLLNDPDGLFRDLSNDSDDSPRGVTTLYPEDFSVRRFIEIIEKQTIWVELVVQ